MTGPGPTAAELPAHIGKYDIVSLVGRGAMGVVYHAHDPLLDRDVALKVMLPQVAADPDQKGRFEREARAAARIVHPNVLTVFDLGYHQDGSPYLAMELLKGRDLLELMRAGVPLSVHEKVRLVVQLLDGLGHAHQAGVVHRDVKPANVFVTQDGTVKIMDFGIARFTMSTATSAGSVMGSPDYMSPEQVQGVRIDGRSDLWSVGCVLHELLTGRRPFAADTLMTIFFKITHDRPDPVLPDSPEMAPLARVLARAMARDLAARYATAAEFAGDLRAYLEASPPQAAAQAPMARPGAQASRTMDLLQALAEEERAGLAGPPSAGGPGVGAAPGAVAPPPDPSPLFRLMREVYVASRSGHLHFAHSSGRRSLFFHAGDILHGTSDVEGEHLGDVLVRYGFIQQTDLERVIPVVLRERKRIGVVIQETGILDAARLEEGVALHVRDVLFNVVEHSGGSFAFEEMAVDPAARIGRGLPPGQIILEAARRLQAPEAVTRVLGDLDRTLAVSALPRVAQQKLTLSPTDGFLLSRIDGLLTAREIFQIIPVAQEDVERSLFALLCTGMVEYLPRTMASRARAAAGVERPAPAAPPPAAPAPGPAAAAEPLPISPAIIDDVTPGLPVGDQKYGEALQALSRAQRLLAVRKPEEAVGALGPALVVLGGRHAVEARLTLARAYLGVARWMRRAEEVLLPVLRESPDLAEAHVLLGRALLAQDRRGEAVAAFRRALRLDPTSAEARAELETLGAR